MRLSAPWLTKLFETREPDTGRLPDFIIGGFPKCGTSSLMRNLGRHPDIHIPKHEVRYFNNNSMTLDEYCALFLSDKKRAGEKTPSYYYKASTMRKMHECLPRVKLVVCIRHPIHMLHSFYHFRAINVGKRSLGFEARTLPFEHIILAQLDISGVSEQAADYALHLGENVLPYYRRRKLLFMVQERLVNNPQEQYRRLQQWLGVTALPVLNRVVNRNSSGTAYYPSIDYSRAEYRRALTGLIERYEPRIKAIRELLGEPIPEWDAFDDFYRNIAQGQRPASSQLSILAR